MDYTCIGDPVNTTARIETACKTLKTDILVSNRVRTLLGDTLLVDEPSSVSLEGKREPMLVYPLLDTAQSTGPTQSRIRRQASRLEAGSTDTDTDTARDGPLANRSRTARTRRSRRVPAVGAR